MYYNEIESRRFGEGDNYNETKVDADKYYFKLRYFDLEDGVKLVADRYYVKKPEDDYCEVICSADFLTISTYDRATQETTNACLLECLANCNRYYYGGEKNADLLKQYFKDIFGIEYDINILDGAPVLDYIRRIIFLKQKPLFKKFGNELHSHAECFAFYLNNLDDIEKLSSVMKPEAIVRQMKDKTLKFNDGKKLKQLIGVPVDIIKELNAYGVGHRLPVFQTYLNEKGGVDDIRKLFDWLNALKKLNRKRKITFNVTIDTTIVDRICDIIQYGANIPNLMSVVSREMLMYQTIQHIDLSDILRNIKDTLFMLDKMGYSNRTINQNVDKWHFIVARNCKLISNSRAEAYSQAAAKINEKSMLVDGYLIKCPTTEQELFDIGNAYNNCLPIYRDKIIDENAIIYSMYSMDQTETIPSVTFEVTKNYDFVQIKTFNDMDVCDEQIIEVLKKWRSLARKEIKDGQKVHANQQYC